MFIWLTIRIKIFFGKIIFSCSVDGFDFEGVLVVRKPQVPELFETTYIKHTTNVIHM